MRVLGGGPLAGGKEWPGQTAPAQPSSRGGGTTPNRFSFQRARLATESADGLDPALGVFCCLSFYGPRPAGRLDESRRVGGRSRGVRSRSAGSGHPPAGVGDRSAGAGRPLAATGQSMADAGQSLAATGRRPSESGGPCFDRLLPPTIDGQISASVEIYVLCRGLSPGDRRGRGVDGSLKTESDRRREPNRPRSKEGCDARRRERAPPFPDRGDGGAADTSSP
jgi:hypothetical protein